MTQNKAPPAIIDADQYPARTLPPEKVLARLKDVMYTVDCLNDFLHKLAQAAEQEEGDEGPPTVALPYPMIYDVLDVFQFLQFNKELIRWMLGRTISLESTPAGSA